MSHSKVALLAWAMAATACTRANPEQPWRDMTATVTPDLAAMNAPLDLHAASGADLAHAEDLHGFVSAHLRLVTGNLTSGNDQSYEDYGIRIFKGVAADVAMIQELNVGGNSSAELRGFVDQAFGTDYAFTRGSAAGQIPNGIASRYPIIASGEWIDSEVGNRDFVWAQIDVPGPIDLYVISVHLLSTTAAERAIEAGELAQQIVGLPSDAYVVLAGDFNTSTRSEACVQTLASVLVTAAPYPADQAGLDNTNANRNKPYDWVLANGALASLETAVAIGGNTFDHGAVIDTRVYSPIADLAPAIASDSGASNMQHMAVVRDFALPGASPGD